MSMVRVSLTRSDHWSDKLLGTRWCAWTEMVDGQVGLGSARTKQGAIGSALANLEWQQRERRRLRANHHEEVEVPVRDTTKPPA